MIFVDTGHFIAVLNSTDALHGRALAWGRAVRERLVVTEYVLWETVNSESRHQQRARVHRLLLHIARSRQYEVIPATPQWYERGLALHRARGDKDWSLTDCISFEVMRERGIVRALTHDQHFEQAGFEAMLRRDP